MFIYPCFGGHISSSLFCHWLILPYILCKVVCTFGTTSLLFKWIVSHQLTFVLSSFWSSYILSTLDCFRLHMDLTTFSFFHNRGCCEICVIHTSYTKRMKTGCQLRHGHVFHCVWISRHLSKSFDQLHATSPLRYPRFWSKLQSILLLKSCPEGCLFLVELQNKMALSIINLSLDINI